MRPLPLVIATVSVLVLACGAPGTGDGSTLQITEIKLGTLKRMNGGLAIDQEVTRLPLVQGRSGDLATTFGICFNSSGGSRPHELTVLIHSPGEIVEVRPDAGLDRIKGGLRTTIPLPDQDVTTCRDMWFDDTDPPGLWHFTLADGEQVLRTWEIEVYKP